jgi:hypothetical protein
MITFADLILGQLPDDIVRERASLLPHRRLRLPTYPAASTCSRCASV